VGSEGDSAARVSGITMSLTQRVAFLFLLAVVLGAGQGAPGAASEVDSRATAYYHFTMGHLYAELAGMYGNRSEYVDKAIEHYKAALKADPGATFLAEELTDLYIQAGRLRDAVVEAEQMLARDPGNVEAHRILGRIYSRMIGDPAQGRLDEGMLRRAIEQFQKVTEKDPSDAEAFVTLGRLYRLAQNSVEAEKAFQKALELDPDNEYALHGLALLYSDLGDTKTAVQMWERLAQRNPHPRIFRALAATLSEARDYSGAVAALRRALELAPKDTEIKRELAENLLLKGDYNEAATLYRELADANPRDAQYPLRLSQIYRQQGDLKKAREAHERARALDPGSLEVQYNEVNLLEAEGQLASAIARLKEILNSTARVAYAPPERANRVMLLERLGLMYRANEQPSEAVEAFRQMAQLDADLGARAAAQIIETYRAAKQFAQAEQEAERAFKQYPNDRMLRLVRASLLADLGRGAEAVAEVKRLLDGSKDRETYLALAQICEKTKDFAGMAAALDEAERLSQSDEEREVVFFMRGAMYERMKKYDQAEAEFRRVLKMNPRNASALNYLGYMFADREVNLEEALELIQRAVELEPNNGAYLDSLGWVYYRLGRLDEAERYLRLALERVPRDPTVNDHLGDVLYRQGKIKEAIAQWQISLKEWEAGSKAELEPDEVAKIQKKLEGAKSRLAKDGGKASPR
jgi:tetratricopeptide (TPR) repeat protein